jgi:hypothetical protein
MTVKMAQTLSVAAIVIGLICAGVTANYDELAAKGYRWVIVDGPYACISRDDLRMITSNHTGEEELQLVKQHRAYYLLRGDIVKLIKEDPASDVSLVHIAGITRDLWTRSKFLSKHPIANAFGVVETPETSGLAALETESTRDALKHPGLTPASDASSPSNSDVNER